MLGIQGTGIEIKKIVREIRDVLFFYSRYRPVESGMGDLLQLFYIDLRFTLYDKSFEWFDSCGIPYRVYRDVGKQYNPTRVAGYAFANWNTLLESGEKRYKAAFLRQADWFVQTGTSRGDALVWEYNFDWGSQLKAPWISGMAQGEALSVLTRAYSLTKDSRYAETAEKAARIMRIPVSKGGVLSQYEDGAPCIEEYPCSQGQPLHVLNGLIYALFGLYDYLAVFEDSSYREFYQECIEALSRNLWRYDMGYWSRYDLASDGVNPATCSYHDLHIAQLRALYSLTEAELFQQYAIKWEGYQKRAMHRLRALMAKARYRMKHPALR